MEYTFSPLGDQAVMIAVEAAISNLSQRKVNAIVARLDEVAPSWMVEYIPAYTTVTVIYELGEFIGKHPPFEQVCLRIQEILIGVQDVADTEQRIVSIPVLYGGSYGPDLDFVAEYNGLTPCEVIEIHTSGDYTVHMIGFAPGFPFIGGMSEKISAPRKETPRLKIPARSVGIAGMQTGVYPIETPGGWQLMGRTPLELFLPNEHPPSLLAPGDKIRFYEITIEEYKDLRGDDE
ncbi:5-oxoprolinase subunit PxpB [Sporosarcina highlanderae]|uniref:5-oxoprolinase subunit PxpB n=1 Tax=Sporosarcina highlanderae TaxID=3035916 RepID=A0ABT8JQG9_9BACL|nr:5-oxoprolinase subunit PxpB [Sporosarcina highlanderae]MDN4606434.1 5-oxoprolinase subunit PxpB [Sporosarcina highlanderae]